MGRAGIEHCCSSYGYRSYYGSGGYGTYYGSGTRYYGGTLHSYSYTGY
jgi:hypothetical protein